MSYQENVIEELQELYSAVPAAFVFEGCIFQTSEWSRTKKGKCYVINKREGLGLPEGWFGIEEGQEYYVGRSGNRLVAVSVDRVAPLFAKNDRVVERVAENICHALDVEPEQDSSMDNDDYGMWQ